MAIHTTCSADYTNLALIRSLSPNDNVASPNNICCIVSLNVIGLTLTTCHLSLAGSPLMRTLDRFPSPIPTGRARADISEINFSADSVFSNFRFSIIIIIIIYNICIAPYNTIL